jgi:hypothetical protein
MAKMASNNRILALAVVLLASAAVPRVEATVCEAATFDEKVANAAAIVVGKVVKKESRFDPTRRFILTYTTFRVEKTLKGGAPSEVTLVTPGGEVDGIYQNTIGVPVFEEGRENVVFVKNTSVGPTVLYLDQGAYDVQRDGSEDRIVAPVDTDAVRIDTQRGIAATPEEPKTLREFERAVRDSERRARFNRMEVLRGKMAPKETSLWDVLTQNKALVILALAGIALATLRLMRRA